MVEICCCGVRLFVRKRAWCRAALYAVSWSAFRLAVSMPLTSPCLMASSTGTIAASIFRGVPELSFCCSSYVSFRQACMKSAAHR
jgi:hypothetical protein